MKQILAPLAHACTTAALLLLCASCAKNGGNVDVTPVQPGDNNNPESPFTPKEGTCIWHDAFVSEFYPGIAQDGVSLDLKGEVKESSDTPGLYTISGIYSPANICTWFGLSEEDMTKMTSFWKEAIIVVDASDTNAVKIPMVNLGIRFNGDDGWVCGGSQYEGVASSVGTLRGGVLTFPSNGLFKTFEGGRTDSKVLEANTSAEFKVTFNFDKK